MANRLDKVVGFTSPPSLSEKPKDHALLATAAIAGAIFGGDLVLIGLVGLGIVVLPFIWPVALGVLAGAVIIGVIVYAILHSSKVETVEQDAFLMESIPLDDGSGPPLETTTTIVEEPEDKLEKDGSIEGFETIEKGNAPDRSTWIKERQRLFLARAKEAEECFRGEGWIDDNALKYCVLALSIFFAVSCKLTVSEGKSFDDVGYCQKLNDAQPRLFIRTVCLEPCEEFLKHFKWVRGMSSGNRVCLEPHASVFLSRDGNQWEYFDPKAIPLHTGLKERIAKTSREVKSLVEGNISEYRNSQGSPPQIQSLFNAVDCGIHVCRRIEQYFKGNESNYLSVLTDEEMREVRERFADLIHTFVIDAFERPSNWKQLDSYEDEIEKRSQLFAFQNDIYEQIHTSLPSNALS